MWSVCLVEKQQIPILVFSLQLPGLEPLIYRTQGEHANHYATDAVFNVYVELINMLKLINFKSGCERRGC
jgi:hypothetical protein